MQKRPILTLLLIAMLLLVSGCGDTKVIPNDEFSSPGANEIEDTADIYFFTDDTIYDHAIVGQPYKYSFCGPDVETAQDICGKASDQYNPAGGNAPYHFVLESGTGFAPMGLTLSPNGLLSGIPTAAGTSTFSVCAVDQSGKQACSKTSLEVKEAVKVKLTLTGDGSGNITDGWDPKQVCVSPGECTFFFEKDSYASIRENFANGTGFGGYSGDCTGTFCSLDKITSDKTISAKFVKLDLTFDSLTCQDASIGDVIIHKIMAKGTVKGPAKATLEYTAHTDDLNKDPDMLAYIDPDRETSGNCGAWTKDNTISHCVNTNDVETSSWTITHVLHTSKKSFVFKADVIIRTIDGIETVPVYKEVACS